MLGRFRKINKLSQTEKADFYLLKRGNEKMKNLIKLTTVKSMTGLSKSSIYAMMQKGQFPKSVTIGARAVAWIEAEIQNWIEEKISLSRVA